MAPAHAGKLPDCTGVGQVRSALQGLHYPACEGVRSIEGGVVCFGGFACLFIVEPLVLIKNVLIREKPSIFFRTVNSL